MKNIGKTTLDWLEKPEVPYDEIYFGKPNARVYGLLCVYATMAVGAFYLPTLKRLLRSK